MTLPPIDPAIQLTARGALTLLFLSAAGHKLRDVRYFRTALEGYALLPAAWTVPAGAALVALELGVGVGLWLPRVAPVAALIAAALLMLYGSAMAVNLARGRRDIDCGCAGPARRQPVSGALVVRNLALSCAALLGALPAAPRAWTWVDALTIGAGIGALVLLYVAADGLLAAAARWPRHAPAWREAARA